jgi:hypothetical protein
VDSVLSANKGRIMKTIVLDSKVHEFDHEMQVRDETGRLVGVFLPTDAYQGLLSNIKIPYSDEEIAQRAKEPGVCSLDDIWKKLGVK